MKTDFLPQLQRETDSCGHYALHSKHTEDDKNSMKLLLSIITICLVSCSSPKQVQKQFDKDVNPYLMAAIHFAAKRDTLNYNKAFDLFWDAKIKFYKKHPNFIPNNICKQTNEN